MPTAFLDRVSNKAIGQMLLEKGVVSDAQLEEALELGREERIRVGEALVRLGYISRETLSYVLGEQYGVRPMELHPSMLDERLIRRFPIDFLQQHQVLPLIELGNELVVVVSDPNETHGLRELSSLAPAYTILPQLADAAQLRRCIESLRDRLPRATGHTTPLSIPTECRLEAVVPAPTDVTFANWLVATALQEPATDLIVRQLGDCCQVARRQNAAVGGGIREIHRFGSDAFNCVRDALLRNCVTLEHTGQRAAAWASPLRFAATMYDLLVIAAGPQQAPVLKLRALQRAGSLAAGNSVALPNFESGHCTALLYKNSAELSDYLEQMLLQCSGSQLVLLLQDATRRSFEGVQALPGSVAQAAEAASELGATCVVFDTPPAVREVMRLLRNSTEPPSVIVCAPTVTGSDDSGTSPDLDELRRRIPCDVVHVELTSGDWDSASTGGTN